MIKRLLTILNLLAFLVPLLSPASVSAGVSILDIHDSIVERPGYKKTADCDTGSSYSGQGGDLDKLQRVFAFRESGGNPTAGNDKGGAFGKYQYIDLTWRASATRYYPPAAQYSRASAAPESVQDAVFRLEYTKKLKDFNNDMFKIIVSHYLPLANEDPSKLDIIPSPEAGNTQTPRQYANITLENMQKPGPWDKIELHYQEAPEFNTWLEKIGGSTSSSAGQTTDQTATTSPTGGSSGTGASTTPTSGNNQQVYILGDSIIDWFANADAAHAQQYGVTEKGLEKKLQEAKWQPTINALGGRQLSGDKYAKPDGLAQLDSDQTKVASADIVVIALGTNRDNAWTDNTKDAFRQHVDQAIDNIKKNNKNHDQAKIYWVNLAYAGATLSKEDPGSYPYDQSFNDYNSVLQEESTKKGFHIIDWKSKVASNQAFIKTDDANLDGYAHVHPSPSGTTAYIQMILDGISANNQANNNTQGCVNNTGQSPTGGQLELEYEDTSRPTPGVGSSRKIKVHVWGAEGQSKPLVVFAHGWREGPKSYARYIQALASQGFVVAAPSFPLADKDVDGDKLNRDNSLPYQAGDLKFVTDQLTKETKLKGKIDDSKIGIVGHSDGAMAVLRDGYASGSDNKVKAVVAISADNIANELGTGPPFMIIHGDGDTIASYGGDHANYEKISANPKYFVTMLGADHFEYVAHSAPDTPALDNISSAFLKNQLKGETNDISSIVSSQYAQQAKVEKP